MLRPPQKVGVFLKSLMKGLRYAEIGIAAMLFSAALVVLTLNVIFRRIPWLPTLDWAEEFMRYCSIWITFLGMALCAEKDLHVGVDIVYQVSPTKVRKVLKIICMLAAVIFCAIFTYACFNYVMMAMQNMQRSPVMQVPLWIIYSALPLGSAITTLQYALKLVESIRVRPEALADKSSEEAASEINLLDLS